MKRFDVTALGELLIDFTDSGESERGNRLLEANPGGAPCNVLAMLQKLGKQTAFLGKVGQDAFGDLLEQTLQEAGICTGGLRRDTRVHTTLAFVHTLSGGERSFSFYRNPGADVCLAAEELDEELLESCRIFHFGSLSLTDEPCREATRAAVQEAKKAGALISFDPNLRESLWDSLEHAKEQIAWGLSRCDVLKMPHHGKNFKALGDLLDTTQPSIALITDGLEEPADPETLDLLQSRSIDTYRTSKHRTIRIRSYGSGEYIVDTHA